MEPLVRRLKGLVEFCGYPDEARLKENRIGAQWSVSGRDGAWLSVATDTLVVTLESWMESYHNGDHYDSKKRVLPPEEALEAVGKLLEQYEAKALQRAKQQVEEEEQRKRRQRIEKEARQRLAQFLEAKIVLDS